MLFLVDIRINTKTLTLDELWDLWITEAKSALEAKKEGKLVTSFKVSGQRRVISVLDVESHHELDSILMNDLPMAHYLTIAEIVPVRDYEAFAQDLENKWSMRSS